RNLYNLEYFTDQNDAVQAYDAMVLDISINSGAYEDIVDAGGSFVSGGYNARVSDCCENPLAGRMAWTALSGGTLDAPAYITTLVNLPSAAIGQTIRLRWRVGCDTVLVADGQP